MIFTPPKCGTTSLTYQMCEKGPGINMIGPQIDGLVERHTNVVPWAVAFHGDYKRAMLIRNPYTRAVSLYGHMKRWFQVPDMTFRHFVRRVLLPGAWAFYSQTLIGFKNSVQEGYRPNVYIRMEHMKEDLASKLGIEVDVPHLNKSETRGLLEYGDDQEIKDLVRAWGLLDFELGDYSKEFVNNVPT